MPCGYVQWGRGLREDPSIFAYSTKLFVVETGLELIPWPRGSAEAGGFKPSQSGQLGKGPRCVCVCGGGSFALSYLEEKGGALKVLK